VRTGALKMGARPILWICFESANQNIKIQKLRVFSLSITHNLVPKT